MKDGVAAVWYILRFNLFNSLADSYRAKPSLGKEVKPR
jgi:hypothetical protein